jgi:hypothetical protein
MTKLEIELPDELEKKLTVQAQKQNISLENFILQSLTQSVDKTQLIEPNPILPLIGCISLDITDLSENHDYYI